jgi:DNA-binding MarR family transcriptional regulator
VTDHVARILDQWSVERPDLDVSPIGLIGRLHRLAARLTEELNTVYRQYGLAEGDFDALVTLRRQGAPFALTCSALAGSTMITSGGMTKRIDRLVAAGLVRRRDSESDGRSRLVELTVAGRELVDDAFTAHVANEHRLVAALDAADREKLTEIVTHWLDRLER